jgi:hypothetical protein
MISRFLCEKLNRDREEALPRTSELAAFVVSLPSGRGSVTRCAGGGRLLRKVTEEGY